MNVPSEESQKDLEVKVFLQLNRLQTDWELGHKYLVQRVDELEKDNRRIKMVLADWYGESGEEGMRKVLKEMILERSTVTLGWRMILAVGAFGSSVAAMVISWLGWHK